MNVDVPRLNGSFIDNLLCCQAGSADLGMCLAGELVVAPGSPQRFPDVPQIVVGDWTRNKREFSHTIASSHSYHHRLQLPVLERNSLLGGLGKNTRP